MKEQFICPHCKGHLNARKNIIFIAQTSTKERGIILLSPEIGDYKLVKHPEFILPEGDDIQLFCPICHANLVQEMEPRKKLAKIIYIDSSKKEHDLYFSGIVGERSTFKVTDGKVKAFGQHSSRYIDFFNLSGLT